MAKLLKWTLVVFAAVALSLAMLGGALAASTWQTTERDQAALAPFYATPESIPAPGTLIRSEPMDLAIDHGTAYRVLYATTRPGGTPAVSGGMVFVPDAAAPAGGRNVVAWAHGTIGQGDQCAPSRSTNPLGDMTTWLPLMMRNGWVVTATDYTGLGTQGPNLYLVGRAEADDVVNSVRAARQLDGADASGRYVVFGHSQGGHSAIWTGALSEDIAPELDLLGVAAAAPAGELTDIMGAQWPGAVGWAIGPEVVESWPAVFPALDVDGVLSDAGRDNWRRLADECVIAAALEGTVRVDLGQEFFATDPTANPSWAAAARAETPRPLPASMPMWLGQSTADQVVLAWPNAVLQERFCAAGSDVTSTWVGQVSHQDTALVLGPDAVGWMTDRFAGRPTTPTCNVPPPITAQAPAS